ALLNELISATEKQVAGPAKGLFSINSVIEFGTRDPEITAILWEHYQAVWLLLCEALVHPENTVQLKAPLTPQAAAHTLLTTMYGYVSILRVKPDFNLAQSLVQSLSQLFE